MIRKKTAPSYRLICVVLAVVLLLALAVPGLAEHQWSNQIHSFERTDPVYDETVELGTARDALHLPDTLRAIVGIPEEMDVSTFLQAAPEADTSDGSESFDYYWYGYVAPKGADALVEAGEKAIYTIYYANGDLAYRLYGSIEGSENLWFACDEAGNITGAVLDIPVEWSGSYDGETAGTYTFTARVSGESSYHWSGSAPTATVCVLQSDSSDADHSDEPVCTCGAQPDENGITVHAEDCPCYTAPEPVCTCGAQPDENGVTVHAEDCPCYTASEPVCTCGAQPREDGAVIHAEDCPCYVSKEIHCTCTVGEDVVSSDHDASCPFYQAALLCTCGLATNEPSEQHAEDCPCYVLPLTDCHCGLDGEPIAADNYPWAHQADCKYFSPIECMCREQVAVEVEDYDPDSNTYLGTHTEYVPGDFSHVHDPENVTCPLYGKDTVRIIKLNTGEESVMSVEDAERLVAYQNTHGASDRDIYTVARDPEQEDATQESAENAAQQQESTAAMYPALGCISIIEGSEQAGMGGFSLMSVNGNGGTEDERGDALMRQYAPTSGNAAADDSDPEVVDHLKNALGGNPSDFYEYGISGVWRDYVCTIWQNKVMQQFSWTPNSSIEFNDQARKGWAWSGMVADETTGDVTTNPKRSPVETTIYEKDGITVKEVVWIVYSGEQLLYALQHYKDNQVVRLGDNIDLNGMHHSWPGVTNSSNNTIIDGAGFTIYNYGNVYDSSDKTTDEQKRDTVKRPVFLNRTGTNSACTIQNLSFVTAKIVQPMCSYGGLFQRLQSESKQYEPGTVKLTMTDLTFERCLNYSGVYNDYKWKGANGTRYNRFLIWGSSIMGQPGTSPLDSEALYTSFSAKRVYFINNYMFGKNHVSLGFLCVYNGKMENCASIGCMLVGTGGHSGGLLPCSTNKTRVEKCFISAEMYGARDIYGLGGASAVDQCYTTGKMEGYKDLSGLGGGYRNPDVANSREVADVRNVTRSYSTMLVGLRTEARNMAGFATGVHGNFEDCYAAGEVGSHTTPLEKVELSEEDADKKNVGGFGSYANSRSEGLDASGSYTNCYYDKQTTAMRENALWGWKTDENITGLLTTSAKGGIGMASGQNFGLGPQSEGVWSYSPEHYPQLQVFSGATNNSTAWGGMEMAQLVEAVSKASTATVFLNTWEKGYDWDEKGVRSAEKVDYNREPDGTSHRADKYTYDTVREIISPFTVTNTTGTWKELITGGAKTRLEVVGGTSQSATTKNIVIKGTNGTVEGPGMNWFSVSEQVGNETASRPLRLTGYMSIDAGDDRTGENAVESGAYYNHRNGVTLTMMDSIEENRVLGWDDTKYWSTAKRAGYPTEKATGKSPLSPYYYGVPTDHENHLKTNFSASIGAILNTEIWRVAKTEDGAYMQDGDGYSFNCSVKVTGEGTSGISGADPTKDEKKWNGNDHFFVDENQMYEVSYYWQLADGRYVTDSKLVEIIPTTRYLTVEAQAGDDHPITTALYLEAYEGDKTTVVSSGTTRGSVIKEGIPVEVPSTAVWKKANSDAEITRIEIQMKDALYVQGSKTISKETIEKVTVDNPAEIWIPIEYFYTADVKQASGGQTLREESHSTTALVRYDLCVTEDGTYYIMFNREHNGGKETETVKLPDFPADMDEEKKTELEKEFEGLNFKDMHYNVRVVVKVEENAYVQVKKVVSGHTDAMKDQTFTINLTREGTNESVAQVNLKAGEISNVIKVPIIRNSDIILSEVLPMEFQLESLTFTQPEGSKAVLTNDGTLTLHAGDRVTLIVHNTYTGQGYFKSRTQKNNTFWPAT